MKKFFKITAIVLVVLLLMVNFILPKFLHLDNIRNSIIEMANQIATERLLDTEYPIEPEKLLQIGNQPRLNLFPFGVKLGNIHIDHIYYQNRLYKVELDKLVLAITPWKIFNIANLDYRTVKVILYKPQIKIADVKKSDLQIQQLNVLRQVQDYGRSSNFAVNIERWETRKGSISYGERLLFNKISLKVLNNAKYTRVDGNFAAGNELTDVNIDLDYSTGKFNIALFANLFSFRAANNLEKRGASKTVAVKQIDNTNDIIFNGQMRFGTRNLQTFLERFFVFSRNSWVNKIIFNGQLNMSSENFGFGNGIFKLDDFKIISEVINGGGFSRSSRNYQGKLETQIRLHLPSLNFDRIFQGLFNTVSIYSIKTMTESRNAATEAKQGGSTTVIPENKDITVAIAIPSEDDISRDKGVTGMNMDFSIGSLNYMDETFKNINISIHDYISQKERILVVSPFSMIDSSGNFYIIEGIIKDDAFNGRLFSTGSNFADVMQWMRLRSNKNVRKGTWKNYVLLSDLELADDKLMLNHMYLNVDGIQAKANLLVNDLNSKMKLTGDAEVRNMDFYSYFVPPTQAPDEPLPVSADVEEQKILEVLLANSQQNKLDFALLALNNLWLDTNVKINFYNSIFGKYIRLSDGSFVFRSAEGFIAFEDIYFFKNTSRYQREHRASFSIDIKTEMPEFKINLDIGSIAINKPDQEANIVLNYLDDSVNFNDLLFMIPPMRNVSGRVGLDVEDLYFYDWHLQDIITEGSDFLGGGLIFSDLNFNLLGGNMKLDTSLSMLDSKAIVAAVSGVNINNRELAKTFKIQHANNLFGSSNIRGLVKSSGKNWGDFVKALSIALQISSNNTVVKGIGLNDLVSKSFYPIENKTALKDLNKFFYNPEQVTAFTKLTGVFRKKPDEGPIDMRIVTQNKLYNTTIQGQLRPNYNVFSKSVLDLAFNIVFVTGTQKNAMSLRIAGKTVGTFDQLSSATNFSQVYTYLNYYWNLDKLANKLLLPDVEELASDVQELSDDELRKDAPTQGEGNEPVKVSEPSASLDTTTMPMQSEDKATLTQSNANVQADTTVPNQMIYNNNPQAGAIQGSATLNQTPQEAGTGDSGTNPATPTDIQTKQGAETDGKTANQVTSAEALTNATIEANNPNDASNTSNTSNTSSQTQTTDENTIIEQPTPATNVSNTNVNDDTTQSTSDEVTNSSIKATTTVNNSNR